LAIVIDSRKRRRNLNHASAVAPFTRQGFDYSQRVSVHRSVDVNAQLKWMNLSFDARRIDT